MAKAVTKAVPWEPRNKFTSNELGDLSAVRKLPDGDKTIIPLGSVIGKVTGISYKFNPNNPEEPSIALNGMFEGIPADPKRAVIRSPRWFPPNAICKMIASAITKNQPMPKAARGLKRGQSVDIQGAGTIPIAVEIGVRKTGTAIGYEYVTAVHGNENADVADALADVRGLLPEGPTLLALPAPGDKGRKKRK